MKLEENTNLMQRYLILEALAYAGGQFPPPPTPRYREKVKRQKKRRENGKKPQKGERNKENSKKKWNRKSKPGNGREKGNKIAENRENRRNFCKIYAIYIDIFSKKFISNKFENFI